MALEDDPAYAESRAEQLWLDRHGYPNIRQWETYNTIPEALLEQAANAGDPVARTMLDARLLRTDPDAQRRLIDAGSEGNLFALSMLASYQGGSGNGDPVFAYALSKAIEMRGDSRIAITRDVMISKSLSFEQRLLAEAEAIQINEELNSMFRKKHGRNPTPDVRPLGQN